MALKYVSIKSSLDKLFIIRCVSAAHLHKKICHLFCFSLIYYYAVVYVNEFYHVLENGTTVRVIHINSWMSVDNLFIIDKNP